MATSISKYEHWAQRLLKDTGSYDENQIRNINIRWENTQEAFVNFLKMLLPISSSCRNKIDELLPVMVYRYWYCKSYREIDKEFNFGNGTATTRVKKCLIFFRDYGRDYGRGWRITLKGTGGNEQRYTLIDLLSFGQARTQRILEMYSKQIADLSKLDIKQLNEELKAYVKTNNTKETAKLREYMTSNDKFKVKQTNFDALINNFGVNTVGEIKEAIYNIKSDVKRTNVRKRKELSTSVPIVEAFEILDLLIYKKYNRHIIKRIKTQNGTEILNWSV